MGSATSCEVDCCSKACCHLLFHLLHLHLRAPSRSQTHPTVRSACHPTAPPEEESRWASAPSASARSHSPPCPQQQQRHRASVTKELTINTLIHLSISQHIHPSIHQYINQSINPSINTSTHQSIHPSSINEAVNQYIHHLTINTSIINQYISELIYLSVHQ